MRKKNEKPMKGEKVPVIMIAIGKASRKEPIANKPK